MWLSESLHSHPLSSELAMLVSGLVWVAVWLAGCGWGQHTPEGSDKLGAAMSLLGTGLRPFLHGLLPLLLVFVPVKSFPFFPFKPSDPSSLCFNCDNCSRAICHLRHL